MEVTKRRSGGIKVPVSRRVFEVFNTITLLVISFAMVIFANWLSRRYSETSLW